MQYKCPKCGNSIQEGVKFCAYCGQPFNWPTIVPEEMPKTNSQTEPNNVIQHTTNPSVSSTVSTPYIMKPGTQQVDWKADWKRTSKGAKIAVAILAVFVFCIFAWITIDELLSTSGTAAMGQTGPTSKQTYILDTEALKDEFGDYIGDDTITITIEPNSGVDFYSAHFSGTDFLSIDKPYREFDFLLTYQETRNDILYFSSTAKDPYNKYMWTINSDGSELTYSGLVFKLK